MPPSLLTKKQRLISAVLCVAFGMFAMMGLALSAQAQMEQTRSIHFHVRRGR
jgi:hypothetical protein